LGRQWTFASKGVDISGALSGIRNPLTTIAKHENDFDTADLGAFATPVSHLAP